MNAYEGLNVQKILYKSKGQIKSTDPTFLKDMELAKKLAKNALSEVDFKQIAACITALLSCGQLCNKY